MLLHRGESDVPDLGRDCDCEIGVAHIGFSDLAKSLLTGKAVCESLQVACVRLGGEEVFISWGTH